MKFRWLFLSLTVVVLVSCSDYQKLLKSTDYELKWTKANEYYEQKKYQRVIDLLEELQAIHKGTERAEQTLYMLANAYFNTKDYISASHYYETYVKTYPKGQFAEDCRFMAGKAAYLDSPDARLSQEMTYQAINLLNVFLEYYPDSDRKDETLRMLDELNNKLSYLILKSRYVMATQSVPELLEDRYRATIDEYYSFINEFPNSPYRKEADQILKESRKIIKE
jgi:outer membrane protein assembly factor BamD